MHLTVSNEYAGHVVECEVRIKTNCDMQLMSFYIQHRPNEKKWMKMLKKNKKQKNKERKWSKQNQEKRQFYQFDGFLMHFLAKIKRWKKRKF